ncbi:MAG: hypothetical protein KatS3mg027_0217 [Bacteroidia bacterium]|nr:MAG: hypothetical protein KatS3mg027_0217 [Bacteroidia bacterium]
MKFTWGHGITLAFIVFAGFILYMVSKMIQSKVELVEQDYYAKEIAFQKQINKFNNTLLLGDSAVIVDQTAENIRIHVAKSNPDKISLMLYYPFNSSYDRKQEWEGQKNIVISKRDIHKGRCKLKLEWQEGGVSYYYEKEMVID